MLQPEQPTRLEEAVAALCSARTNVDRERTAARARYAEQVDPADRFASSAYIAALGSALDRLDLVLALLTDAMPGGPDLEQLDELLEDLDPSSSAWRSILDTWTLGHRPPAASSGAA